MERRGAQSGQQPAHTSQGFHVNIKHMPGIWYNFLSLVPTMTMPGARTLHTDTGHSQNSQHSCCWIWSTDKFLSLSRPGTISFFQTHEASGVQAPTTQTDGVEETKCFHMVMMCKLSENKTFTITQYTIQPQKISRYLLNF